MSEVTQDDIRGLTQKVDEAIAQSSRAAEIAARNEGVLDSVRNQTGDQWEMIRDLQLVNERQNGALSQVVKDQERLGETLRELEKEDIKELKDTAADYHGTMKSLSLFKWIAGSGLFAGLAGWAAKFFPGTGG